jgi:membrane protein implicated in regulation of membrane protease activity
MDWSSHTQWLLWLAAALAAGLIEVATVDFVFLMFVGGALAAAVAAGVGLPFALQVIVFAASSTGLLFVARPPLQRWARNTPSIAMNAAALVGREARVLETVTERSGLVKLAGEVWTARVAPGELTLEVGSDVHVVRIEGATAMVAANPAPPTPNSLEGRSTP